MPSCSVLAAYSRIWEVASTSSFTKVRLFTHLMQAQPYHPGTTSRTGAPWSRVSGWPFISVARNAPAACNSSRRKIQLAPGTDVIVGLAYSSKPETSTRDAPDLSFARLRMVEIGTPVQLATLINPKCVTRTFPEHSIKCWPIAVAVLFRVWILRCEGCSTNPSSLMVHPMGLGRSWDAPVRMKNSLVGVTGRCSDS